MASQNGGKRYTTKLRQLVVVGIHAVGQQQILSRQMTHRQDEHGCVLRQFRAEDLFHIDAPRQLIRCQLCNRQRVSSHLKY